MHIASPSVCLRDSAHNAALHLRHTTECVLQRVLCHPVVSGRFLGVFCFLDQYTFISSFVNPGIAFVRQMWYHDQN